MPFTGGLFQVLGQRHLSGSKGLNLQALVPLALRCVVVGWSLRAPVLTIRTRGPALRRAEFVVRCAHIFTNLALLRAGPCALRYEYKAGDRRTDSWPQIGNWFAGS